MTGDAGSAVGWVGCSDPSEAQIVQSNIPDTRCMSVCSLGCSPSNHHFRFTRQGPRVRRTEVHPGGRGAVLHEEKLKTSSSGCSGRRLRKLLLKRVQRVKAQLQAVLDVLFRPRSHLSEGACHGKFPASPRLESDRNIQASIVASLGLGHVSSTSKPSSHGRREPSGGAYTMFTPQQVKQFKEAFNLIDQDGDGRVTEADLRVMLSNLGGSEINR